MTSKDAQAMRTFGAPFETGIVASVNAVDFRGLRKLRELVGPPFVTGIVLYGGTRALSFGAGLWAVPLGRL
jgi:hypothetical protein